LIVYDCENIFNAQRAIAGVLGYPDGVGIVRQLSNDYLILLL
jgi:hypothetical protein